MKKITFAALAGLFVALQTVSVFAAISADKTLKLSATIPPATGVNMVLLQHSKANSNGSEFASNNISFDPMTYDTTDKVYRGTYWYSVTISPLGGGGATSVSATYTEGTGTGNPNIGNGAGHGLGWKSGATFVLINPLDMTKETVFDRKMLKDLSSTTVTAAQIGNQLFRMYIALLAGNETPKLTGAETFGTLDRPGTYTGTLVITGTVS